MSASNGGVATEEGAPVAYKSVGMDDIGAQEPARAAIRVKAPPGGFSSGLW